MTERLLDVNGVHLCADAIGDPDAPPILLIYGMSGSMDWWHPEFCARLAAAPAAGRSVGRFVIRYDHRDTGRSVSYPPGQPGYTGGDLVDDAAGLIDQLAGGSVHLVGLSMGGGIAQQLAIESPERVRTLTLMSTSPGSGDDLPPVAARLAAAFADPPPEPDWTDLDAVVEYFVENERPFAGPDTFDEAAVRETARQAVARTVNPRSSLTNHELLAGDDGPPRSRLADVRAPTLVIHGTEDPLLPPEHGRALAREIPGARLLLLDGVGHQTPPRSTWDEVIAAIAEHTGGAERR